MILIIKANKEPLHEEEFVKPVVDIVKKIDSVLIIHYENLTPEDFKKADKIIICGTSLRDNQFVKDISKFRWIKDWNKPVLGICAGMQIIGIIHGSKIKRKQEIGFYNEIFTKKFLGLKGKKEVYHLHNNYITLPKDFIQFTSSKIPQAMKHQSKQIYGILFHSEVRNKKLIEEFCRL